MTKKKTAVVEAAEGISAAELEAQRARDAERDRAREAAEAAQREAEEKARRVIAILNADGVLVGRINNPTDDEWKEAPPRFRFVNGFDNALHRYKLAEWKPGRFRFEAIVHAKDTAEENLEGSPKILAPIARMLLNAAGRHVYRDRDNLDDLDRLEAFLKSLDAKGN